VDYFQLKQDQRFNNAPVISNIRDIIQKRSEFSLKNKNIINDLNVGFSRSAKPLIYADVLDTQLFMVTDEVKRVFECYDPTLIFKSICILNNLDNSNCLYHAPLFREVDCLVPEHKNMLIRRKAVRLAVFKELIEPYSIVKVQGIESDIVLIRLDVIESLMRRNITKWKAVRIELI